MKNNRSIYQLSLLLAITGFLFSSCKKEEVLAPKETLGETVLYIKAVKTDSSVVESERVVLR